MSNTDVQRERLLANTKTWIHDFQGNISPFMVGAHENTASNMVPDVLTALTEYMYDEFGRDQRRWTGATMRQALDELLPIWTDKYGVSVFALTDFIEDYFMYLEDSHHLNNAATLVGAADDTTYGLEFADGQGDDDGLQADLEQPVAMVAAARHLPVPIGEQETVAFMNKYAAEIVLLADDLTLKEAVSLSMPADATDLKQFAHDFYRDYVLPDLDIEGMLADAGMPPLTDDEDKSKLSENDILMTMVEQSLMNDSTPLSQDQRTQLASRIDGDPMLTPAAQRRFVERHQAVMEQYFGVPAAKSVPHNKHGKVIDFATAKRRLEAASKANNE